MTTMCKFNHWVLFYTDDKNNTRAMLLSGVTTEEQAKQRGKEFCDMNGYTYMFVGGLRDEDVADWQDK